MKKSVLILFVLALVFQSCIEDVDLEIVGSDSNIVIEGRIDSDSVAYVLITRTTSVSEQLDEDKLFVENAEVYVSNGFTIDTLKNNIIPYIYYGNPSKLKGVPGNRYYLTVKVDGETYESSTYIPTPVPLDSVWWQPQPPHDTLGYSWVHLTDPPDIGNAYAFFAKRPNRDYRYLTSMGSYYDDKFINGKSFDSFFFRGEDESVIKDEVDSSDKEYDETNFYNIKDTIYIKFCTIDYSTYRFYYTFESAVQNNGNPFGSPINVQSNIEGGALGVWAGYGVSYDTIYPPVE